MNDLGTSLNFEVETEGLSKEKFPSKILTLDEEGLRNDLDMEKVRLLMKEGDWVHPHDRMVRMAKGMIGLSNIIISERADTLVLLDKSARPVAHLLKNLWREIYPSFKAPDIRFVNVGREEDKTKYTDEESLAELYSDHVNSFIGKTVIVADEVTLTGDSIKRAKNLFEKAFSGTKKIIYTAVFNFLPGWYQKNEYLGVNDLDNLPFYGISELERDTFRSKTMSGVIDRVNKKRPGFIDTDRWQEELTDRQKKVNDLRAELSYLGKKIAGHCQMVPLGDEVVKPNLIPDLDKVLNQ